MKVRERAASLRFPFAALCVLATACTPVIDEAYWREYQTREQAAGRSRAERAPTDVTFSNASLIESFRQIMFYDEYVVENGRYLEKRAPRQLEKFTGPVNFSVHGKGVTRQDLSDITAIAERIERATGLTIRRVEEDNPPLTMLFLGRVERLAVADGLPADEAFAALRDDLRHDLNNNVCAAYPFEREDTTFTYLVIIPDEIPGLLRQSCIEEEFAQAFEPAADYDRARPSIFNDDGEFALFTVFDELLFRILYDPRLKPGMSEKEAMPIVRQIVHELRPEQRKAGA